MEVRSLYDLYPDFDIDVQAEQAALLKAELIVWQCPFYWYGVPALVNLWFEKVLAHGWAYGEGADALSGKTVLWVPTTGGSSSAYSATGVHGHPFEAFVPAISQVARFCGMRWAEPAAGGSRRAPADPRRAAREGPPVSNADREPARRGRPWLSTVCSSRR